MLLIFQFLVYLGLSFSVTDCIGIKNPNNDVVINSLPIHLKVKTYQDTVSSQAAIDACWKKVLTGVPADSAKVSRTEGTEIQGVLIQAHVASDQAQNGSVSGARTIAHSQGDTNRHLVQSLQQQKIEQFFARPAHELQFAKFDIDERTQMHAWKSNSWSAYLNLVPGLENPFAPEVKNPYQIFQLYSLYEFSGFRELLKQLPNYDQAMMNIADKLDVSSLNFDSALFEKLSDITIENKSLALYFGQLSLVKEARLKGIQEFKQEFTQEVVADQLKMITELEWNTRNAHISIKQIEQKIDSLEKRLDETWQVQFIERGRLEREIEFLKEFNTVTKANLKHTESKLEIAKQCVVRWHDKFASTLSQLALTDLKKFEISLRKDLQLAHKECDKFLSEYAHWQCRYALAVTQQEKNKIEVEGFRKSIINHDLAVSYYQALKEMHQYSQALVVAKENVESNYYKDRLNALQNLETQTLDKTLTAQGESFLKAKGIHVSEFVKKDANILQRELRSELIELINQAVLLCEAQGIGSLAGAIIHTVPKIAQASLQESGKGEIAKAWMLSDLGNSMLDFVSTYADVMPNAPQQNETVKAVVEKVETAASYAQDVLMGAYKPLDELAQLSAKVLKVAEDVLVGQPVAKSLEDLKKGIDIIKKSMYSEQYKGDFSSIKELLKNEPVEIQQTYAELIEKTRGITDDKVYEGQLFQVISSMQQGKHRGQELRNSSSHEWVQWVSKELSSLLLFETVLAYAEGFYYLAKGEYVGTKASIERGLSKEFLSKLEASEVSQVAVAGTDATVTVVQRMETEAVTGQAEKKVVGDITSDFLTIIPAQFQNEVAQIIEKYEIENVKEAFEVLKINEKGFETKEGLLQRLSELSKDLNKINKNPRWKTFKHDVADGNKVSLKTIEETLGAIAIEEQGLLQVPLTRSNHNGSDFVDALNQAWDIKTPRSFSFDGKPLLFDEKEFVKALKINYLTNENIIINISRLTDQHRNQLFNEIKSTFNFNELTKTIIVDINQPSKSMNNQTLINFFGIK